jgi:hypothetical protein
MRAANILSIVSSLVVSVAVAAAAPAFLGRKEAKQSRFGASQRFIDLEVYRLVYICAL